jgi:hypothetical protein
MNSQAWLDNQRWIILRLHLSAISSSSSKRLDHKNKKPIQDDTVMDTSIDTLRIYVVKLKTYKICWFFYFSARRRKTSNNEILNLNVSTH